MKLLVILLVSVTFITCTEQNVAVEKVTVEFRTAFTEADSMTTPMFDQRSGDTLYIDPKVIISNADVDYASVTEQNKKPVIQLQMNEQGTQKLADFTQSHIGTQIAVILDGEIMMTPTIRAALTDGKAIITGNFSKKEAEKIVRGIMVR
jgi:preprotein translocase subunit SecD